MVDETSANRQDTDRQEWLSHHTLRFVFVSEPIAFYRNNLTGSTPQMPTATQAHKTSFPTKRKTRLHQARSKHAASLPCPGGTDAPKWHPSGFCSYVSPREGDDAKLAPCLDIKGRLWDVLWMLN